MAIPNSEVAFSKNYQNTLDLMKTKFPKLSLPKYSDFKNMSPKDQKIFIKKMMKLEPKMMKYYNNFISSVTDAMADSQSKASKNMWDTLKTLGVTGLTEGASVGVEAVGLKGTTDIIDAASVNDNGIKQLEQGGGSPAETVDTVEDTGNKDPLVRSAFRSRDEV